MSSFVTSCGLLRYNRFALPLLTFLRKCVGASAADLHAMASTAGITAVLYPPRAAAGRMAITPTALTAAAAGGTGRGAGQRTSSGAGGRKSSGGAKARNAAARSSGGGMLGTGGEAADLGVGYAGGLEDVPRPGSAGSGLMDLGGIAEAGEFGGGSEAFGVREGVSMGGVWLSEQQQQQQVPPYQQQQQQQQRQTFSARGGSHQHVSPRIHLEQITVHQPQQHVRGSSGGGALVSLGAPAGDDGLLLGEAAGEGGVVETLGSIDTAAAVAAAQIAEAIASAPPTERSGSGGKSVRVRVAGVAGGGGRRKGRTNSRRRTGNTVGSAGGAGQGTQAVCTGDSCSEDEDEEEWEGQGGGEMDEPLPDYGDGGGEVPLSRRLRAQEGNSSWRSHGGDGEWGGAAQATAAAAAAAAGEDAADD